MRVWTVHAKPPVAGRPPRAVLLRDGFSFFAMVAPLLWFLAHRLFALAALYVAAGVVLAVALPAAAGAALAVGLQVVIGFEARALQAWWLGLRGWRTEAVVMGRDADAAFLTLASARPDLAHAAA